MTKYAELLLYSKSLAEKLVSHSRKDLGFLCGFGFFQDIVPQLINNRAFQDAKMISLLALTLDDAHDEALKNYLSVIPNFGELTEDNFIEFKHNVLRGMYILVWSHYNTSVSPFLNDTFLKLLKNGLNVESPDKLQEDHFDVYLYDLDCYCSYVYQNQQQTNFKELNDKLGISIKSDISILRNNKYQYDDSLYGVYTGIISTLGF